MPAYVVFQSTTIDEAKLESYAAKAIPIVIAHGGRRLQALLDHRLRSPLSMRMYDVPSTQAVA